MATRTPRPPKPEPVRTVAFEVPDPEHMPLAQRAAWSKLWAKLLAPVPEVQDGAESESRP